MIVKQVTKEDWALLSENAHLAVFNKHKPSIRDRIDYALVVENGDEIEGYVTVRELDNESVYWQFGGVFKPGTINSYKAYVAIVAWTLARYTRIATYIENKNTVMLKFAMKVGFIITGIRNVGGSILVEHLLESNGGK